MNELDKIYPLMELLRLTKKEYVDEYGQVRDTSLLTSEEQDRVVKELFKLLGIENV